MQLKGTIEGIELQPRQLAQYKVKSDVLGIGYFYFTFTAERNLYELGDKVKITVESQ